MKQNFHKVLYLVHELAYFLSFHFRRLFSIFFLCTCHHIVDEIWDVQALLSTGDILTDSSRFGVCSK